MTLVCLVTVAAVRADTAPPGDLRPKAQLGQRLFFESRLSASGTLSCASCHDPANAYAAPPEAGPVMRGGARLDRWGLRSVPSLRYLGARPQFARHAYLDVGSEREDVGPAGGFMLDGRMDQLARQALAPLVDSAEMANGSLEQLAGRFSTRYIHLFNNSAFTVTIAAQPGVALQAPLTNYALLPGQVLNIRLLFEVSNTATWVIDSFYANGTGAFTSTTEEGVGTATATAACRLL